MNCGTFRKKLDDYMEDNVSFDIRDAMDDHLNKCEGCKKIYEENILIDSMFKKALSAEGINFERSRENILNNIDKNRYSKNPIKKLYFNIKKNKMQYLSCAAVLAFILVAIPHISKIQNMQVAKNSKMEVQSKKSVISNESLSVNFGDNNVSRSASPTTSKLKDTEVNKEDKVKKEVYMPKFYKTEIKDFFREGALSSPWKNSPDKIYSACVAGKGEEFQEEGIANIFLMDYLTKKVWSFDIIKDPLDKEQSTPKAFEWWDNENLLIVIGPGFGTVTRGGDLYLLNIQKGDVSLIYKMPRGEDKSIKEEIMSIQKINKDLLLMVNVYDDDNYTKSHTEKWLMRNFDFNSFNTIEIVN